MRRSFDAREPAVAALASLNTEAADAARPVVAAGLDVVVECADVPLRLLWRERAPCERNERLPRMLEIPLRRVPVDCCPLRGIDGERDSSEPAPLRSVPLPLLILNICLHSFRSNY